MDILLDVIIIVCIVELIFSITLNVISYKKFQFSVLYLYILIAMAFCIALTSELLSYYWVIKVTIIDFSLDILDFFLVSSLCFALLLWVIAVMYLKGEHLSFEVILMSLLTGFIIAGELYEKMEAMVYINAIVELFGILIFGVIIANHFITTLKIPKSESHKKALRLYLLGFIIAVIGGLLTVLSDFFAHTFFYEILDISWLLGFASGFAIVSIITAKNPHVIISTYARVYRLLIVSPGGTTLYNYDFGSEMRGMSVELVGSAMAGITALTKEIIGKELNLRTFDYEGFFILAEFGQYVAGFLFVERPAKILREILYHAVRRFEEKYGEKARKGDIIISEFKQFDRDVEEIFRLII